MGGIQTAIMDLSEEIAPWRTFGGTRGTVNPYMPIDAFLAAAFDPSRKNRSNWSIRQHKIRVMQRCFVDLGPAPRSRSRISGTPPRFSASCNGPRSSTATVARPTRCGCAYSRCCGPAGRTMIGDLVVFDNWSPYESHTPTGFFPYFRRGKTRGMVDDLIDPQQEINKRRSAQIDIVTRTAHSGWIYHETGWTREGKGEHRGQRCRARRNIKWKGESHMKPERIMPSAPPMAMERLENKGADDLKEISGINDSALGQPRPRAVRPRAFEARQRQSVIAIQPVHGQHDAHQKLLARKKVEIVQNHYTEKRIYRTYGDDGRDSVFTINAKNAAGEVVNNVTDGRYAIVIDETPLAAFHQRAVRGNAGPGSRRASRRCRRRSRPPLSTPAAFRRKTPSKGRTQASAKAPAPTEPTVEAANIRAAEASVEVAKIDSATSLPSTA